MNGPDLAIPNQHLGTPGTPPRRSRTSSPVVRNRKFRSQSVDQKASRDSSPALRRVADTRIGRRDVSPAGSRVANGVRIPGSPTPFKKSGRLTKYSHTYVVHTTIRASPLSKESPEQNFRGFYNLAMLLLAVSNIRLMVENYMKYGLLLSLPFSSFRAVDFKWTVISHAVQLMTILVAYTLQILAHSEMRKGATSSYITMCNVINIAAAIGIPTFLSWSYIWHPALSALNLIGATILTLKLISYVLVNSDLRSESFYKVAPARRHEPTSQDASLAAEEEKRFDVDQTPYPTNLTLGNLLYFVFCPTLCYQTAYPLTPAFRPTFFAKRLLEFITGLAALYLLGGQYAAPTLQNSLKALDDLDLIHLFERVLKLSIVSVVMWLLMFYVVFQCGLNMVAEVCRFGDRRFYLAWWNAKDIAEYWRLWNTPVHYWGKRHVYLPLIVKYKLSPVVASIAVFVISAALHELLVGVPTRALNGWAFGAMMLQLPLILQTKALEPLRKKNEVLFDTVGNYMFWISFTIIGQPTCILIYYSHWYKRNYLSNASGVVDQPQPQ
ncbi:MBOAT, membrane-bound O-acyltransferase family-domain-containing protein [Fimicolochytrium jonesii]|uniref:MBOAT, membrane-bound O-acyltransferase family-domain-containing protein n=1 Tax=Fimicolochytrium jonesii TaxID=1396493 RepID=UPI0022FEDE06|nr:MBOAT, membrane-bound O-acyltransferase family-domain-containing protein [Fimicolochytrium jonesii]KAI8820258.1 MBOAT, membrane-bound O-acyltransferase family-domain-containing protein [Fimicolochytrium jonesii]